MCQQQKTGGPAHDINRHAKCEAKAIFGFAICMRLLMGQPLHDEAGEAGGLTG